MIIIGLSLGLFYGRVLSPVEVVDTNPTSLRVDYKADYVLMVAETFSIVQDPTLALCSLGKLGSSPKSSIENATIFAVQNKYAPEDLVLLNILYEHLKNYNFNGDICQ